jgi:hypothetical protein
MPRLEKFVCDRCSYEQPKDRKFSDDDRWFHTITVYMQTGYHAHNSIPYRLDSDRDTDHLGSVLWCDRCVIELGLLGMTRVSRTPIPEPPQLEAILREFIAEAVADAKD